MIPYRYCYFMIHNSNFNQIEENMVKPARFTYEDFMRLCQEMQASGQHITLRNIQKQLGGSFTKLSDFIARWKAENAEPPTKNYITEKLLKSLETELSAIVVEATNNLKQELEAERKQVKDSLSEVKRLEEESIKQQEELEQLKAITSKRINHLELELQVVKEQADITNNDLKGQLKDFLETKIQSARLQGRIEELERHMKQ